MTDDARDVRFEVSEKCHPRRGTVVSRLMLVGVDINDAPVSETILWRHARPTRRQRRQKLRRFKK